MWEEKAIEGRTGLATMPLELTDETAVRIWGASAAASEDEQFRLDVPRRGHVLTTVAEKYGDPIREAVRALSGSLKGKSCGALRESLLSPPRWQPVPDVVRAEAEMAAWAIASIWVVGVAIGAVPTTGRLRDAEAWFFGGDGPERLTDLMCPQVIGKAEKALQAYSDAAAYYELLPYIFDPHGPGSRLSVRRNPATHAARVRKRAEGVFYTPADVAEYMVSDCINSLDDESTPTVFDPACGTGVFLRAALKVLRRRHCRKSAFSLASECLFGADIDPWSLDASAFVLLADIWADEREPQRSPVEVWRRLRLNLGCIDTLRVDPAGANFRTDDTPDEIGERVSLSRLFPELEGEPTVIVGNPPYADLGERPDLGQLRRVFKTVAVRPHANAEIYLAFIEQMTRLANIDECAGALVLPLSIACNIGPQFMATRKLIQETAGHWRFAFFDREPHALFGEDVKTRNAILFWSRSESDTNAVLASGPLRKWRGDSRAAMFNSIRFTEFNGDIRTGIPKVDGTCQAVALKMLSTRRDRLEHAVQGIVRLNLAEAPNADDSMVFVGPTAYNFLNVFLRPRTTVLEEGLILSENPLHAIRCSSSEDALTAFGILTSHLAYWWWHTHGDGFHVSKRFISDFPFGLALFRGGEADRLREIGADLWSAIRWSPIISLNRGRASLAYTPNGYDDVRRSADEALAGVAGLHDGFVDELQQFTAHTVAAKLRDYGGSDTEEGGGGQ